MDHYNKSSPSSSLLDKNEIRPEHKPERRKCKSLNLRYQSLKGLTQLSIRFELR